MDKTVCIVHYNTPELTAYTLRSLNKWTPGCEVIVFDNSDCEPWVPMGGETVIDNTKGQIINFDEWLEQFTDKVPSPGNNYGSAKHCYTIQYLVDNIGKPFVLMDSDILIRRSIDDYFDKKYLWAADVSCNLRKYHLGILKVDPFLCYLNVPMMKKHGIDYFNKNYMWDLSNKMPNRMYDTGAWLLKATRKANLPYKLMSNKKYIFHLRHGSWRDTQWREWVEEHQETWT